MILRTRGAVTLPNALPQSSSQITSFNNNCPGGVRAHPGHMPCLATLLMLVHLDPHRHLRSGSSVNITVMTGRPDQCIQGNEHRPRARHFAHGAKQGREKELKKEGGSPVHQQGGTGRHTGTMPSSMAHSRAGSTPIAPEGAEKVHASKPPSSTPKAASSHTGKQVETPKKSPPAGWWRTACAPPRPSGRSPGGWRG